MDRAVTPTPTRQWDALLKQVLTNIEQKDKTALERLLIDQEEFRRYVWPAIGNRAGKANFDTFHANYVRFSENALNTTLQNLGGTKWELVKTDIREVKKTANGNLVWIRDVVLRDINGSEKTVNLVGCVLEQNGTAKVATYYGVPSSQK